ncbi:hypothetical protein [Pseudonocardia lacus]|uniref:hypothetical protein n=1 Tax=Pseudonocardia lacus TaxID=2835865 RepID=UPI001BDCE91E
MLGLSRQAHYSWLADLVSARDLDNAYLTNAAIDIRHDDPEFGYRFIADELDAAGHVVFERRVWRLCSAAGSSSIRARTRGRGHRPGPPVHDDLVRRDFTTPRPNRLSLTDISEHPTMESLFALLQKHLLSRRRWSSRRASPGSSGPTTADGANVVSAGSLRSSTRPFTTRPLTRLNPLTMGSTEPSAVPARTSGSEQQHRVAAPVSGVGQGDPAELDERHEVRLPPHT